MVSPEARAEEGEGEQEDYGGEGDGKDLGKARRSLGDVFVVGEGFGLSSEVFWAGVGLEFAGVFGIVDGHGFDMECTGVCLLIGGGLQAGTGLTWSRGRLV